jgi:hypothetical protein
MPNPTAQVLIRRFEPILIFHPDESFFPSDAKRYLEHSHLWTVTGTPDDIHSWGEGPFPRSPRFNPPIAALAGEPGAPINLVPTVGFDESFLALAGWFNGGGAVISEDEPLQYADLKRMKSYYDPNPSEYPASNDGMLADSRFWYHAEVFNVQRLRPLVDARSDPRLTEALLALKPNSLILMYYLFFPGSDGGLEGCGEDDNVAGFDLFAGQWTCIALLLEGKPSRRKVTDYEPTWLGMTSRHPDVVTTADTEARHFGMVATEWSKVPFTPGKSNAQGIVDKHAQIYVAKKSHGFYLTPGAQPTLARAPDDIARSWCGAFETMEEKADADADQLGAKLQNDKNSWFKWACLFGGPAGFLVSLIYSGGMAGLASIGSGRGLKNTSPAPDQFDHPPEAGEFGLVIAPAGVAPPLSLTAELVSWPVVDDELALTTTIDNKQYSLMVGTPDNPLSRPVWLPSDDHTSGFNGRWGQRVQHDPRSRRAGMQFLEYWELFLLAWRKAQST